MGEVTVVTGTRPDAVEVSGNAGATVVVTPGRTGTVTAPSPAPAKTVATAPGTGPKGDPGTQGEPGPTGIQGPPGAPGGSAYDHFQTTASAVWTINHNLGRRPSVTVEDSGGTIVYGTYQHITDDTTVLTFSSPFGGRAYLI